MKTKKNLKSKFFLNLFSLMISILSINFGMIESRGWLRGHIHKPEG